MAKIVQSLKDVNAGVQVTFRGEVLQAVHTHCFVHRLNLNLVVRLKKCKQNA